MNQFLNRSMPSDGSLIFLPLLLGALLPRLLQFTQPLRQRFPAVSSAFWNRVRWVPSLKHAAVHWPAAV